MKKYNYSVHGKLGKELIFDILKKKAAAAKLKIEKNQEGSFTVYWKNNQLSFVSFRGALSELGRAHHHCFSGDICYISDSMSKPVQKQSARTKAFKRIYVFQSTSIREDLQHIIGDNPCPELVLDFKKENFEEIAKSLTQSTKEVFSITDDAVVIDHDEKKSTLVCIAMDNLDINSKSFEFNNKSIKIKKITTNDKQPKGVILAGSIFQIQCMGKLAVFSGEVIKFNNKIVLNFDEAVELPKVHNILCSGTIGGKDLIKLVSNLNSRERDRFTISNKIKNCLTLEFKKGFMSFKINIYNSFHAARSVKQEYVGIVGKKLDLISSDTSFDEKMEALGGQTPLEYMLFDKSGDLESFQGELEEDCKGGELNNDFFAHTFDFTYGLLEMFAMTLRKINTDSYTNNFDAAVIRFEDQRAKPYLQCIALKSCTITDTIRVYSLENTLKIEEVKKQGNEENKNLLVGDMFTVHLGEKVYFDAEEKIRFV